MMSPRPCFAQNPPQPAPNGTAEATEPTKDDGSVALGLSPALPQRNDSDGARGKLDSSISSKLGAAEFHGYLRVPARAGIGTRPDPGPGRAETQLHSPPQVPDYNYTTWNYTNNIATPWTELRFSYGTARAKASVVVAAYNLTSAGWRDLTAQLGIDQAWVTLALPELPSTPLSLEWNVGAFSNRYGAAGKYDAGKYDTYLMGRTRVAGETLTATLALSRNWVVMFEHGLGAKLQRPPDGGDPNSPYPTASTFLHHAHAGVSFRRMAQLGAHYLTSWGQDARATLQSPDGRMTVVGVEARLNSDLYGEGYLGFSTIKADHVKSLADAIEVLHSFGGGQFTNNYLGPNSDGTGRVNSVLGQYSYSFGRLSRYPEPFYGDGPDLVASVFGMLTSVTSRDPAFNGTRKLKAGAELLYTPFNWLGFVARWDIVQPDLSDKRQSFQVLSPKVVVRTSFLSNEQITLQYSRYFNGSQVVSSWPTQNATPDKNVLQILATMWW